MIPVFVLLALGGLMHAARSFAPGIVQVGGTEMAFGFLLLSAYFTGQIVARFSLPRLTGYIIAGITAGPFVLALLDRPLIQGLNLVKGVAVCMIALTAGAELNVARIRPLFRVVNSMVIWAVLGSVVVLTLTIYALSPLLPFVDGMTTKGVAAVALMLGVALSAQSPAVVMALVTELRTDGTLTRIILALVIVSDLVIVILYAISSAIASALIGGTVDLVATTTGVSWEVFGSAGIGCFTGMMLGLYIRKVQGGHAMFATMMCVVIAEVSVPLHLDPLIVMLAAGLYLENVSDADAHKLIDGFEAASLPVYLVFFALAGVSLDIDRVLTLVVPVLIICVVRLAVFWGGCRIASHRKNAEELIRSSAWIGLLPQAGLALALAVIIGRTFPTFGPGAETLIIGVVAVNQLIPPIVLRLALIRSGEAGKRVLSAPGDHEPAVARS